MARAERHLQTFILHWGRPRSTGMVLGCGQGRMEGWKGDGWMMGAHQSSTSTPSEDGLVGVGVCRLCWVPRVTPGRVTSLTLTGGCDPTGLLGSLVAWMVPGRAEPVWFRVRLSREQHCPCTGGVQTLPLVPQEHPGWAWHLFQAVKGRMRIMCWEGDTGGDEERLNHSRKCACQTRLG